MVRLNKQKVTGGRQPMHFAAIAACTLGLAACEENEPPRNASEQARIDSAMEEVEAGQARSDINVAEVKASEDLERQEARERQKSAENSAE